MLQAVVKKGAVLNENVSAPVVSDGAVLIKVHYSCISAGTETSSVVNSSKGLIRRALEQPKNIKKAIDMAKSEGIAKTISLVQSRLDLSSPTGYSISGVVIAIGKGVTKYSLGDRVAAAGAGLANHAEFVDVPENLVMKVPTNLSLEEACTVTLGGIALQGVRRVDLKLGEICVVVGAGILGLLALQMLKLSGARVVVIDIDDSRLALAEKLGADMVLNAKSSTIVNDVLNYSDGYGADGVLFTAATSSNEPLSRSFQMCKRKGRVVMVGVAGPEINRADMYEKELDFLLSTSYGPGRYDSNYEQKGLDYPYAYVRWTENRNMTEYLRLVGEKKINLTSMISSVYPFEKVEEAFKSLQSPEARPLMVLLEYNLEKTYSLENKKVEINPSVSSEQKVRVVLIGAGNFAEGVHLPNIQQLKTQYELRGVVSRDGLKSKNIATKFGAAWSSTDPEVAFKDPDIDLVIIATRHDSHASLVLRALKAGKNVFVEKPLAVNNEELKEIENFYADGKGKKPLLFVGFNRRFSKYATEIKQALSERIGPAIIHYRMNAGFIPSNHWVHQDGGRIVGEACHNIDLVRFLIGSSIESVSYDSINPQGGKFGDADNRIVNLKFVDGSIANIVYFSTGARDLSKEHMEVHFDEKSIVMDNFKSLRGFGVKINPIDTPLSQKGQLEELQVLYSCLKGENGWWPISLEEMVETTKASFIAAGIN